MINPAKELYEGNFLKDDQKVPLWKRFAYPLPKRGVTKVSFRKKTLGLEEPQLPTGPPDMNPGL